MGFIKVNEQVSKQQPSTLIWGDLGTGKTTAAYQIVKDYAPLFVVFGGAEVLNQFPGVTYWENPTIKEFENSIVAPLVAGSKDFAVYGSVVLDGLFEYAQQDLTEIAGVDGVLQKHWGMMSKRITDNLVKLRRVKPLFVATVLTQLSVATPGLRETTLNPELHKRTTGLFGVKQYTYKTFKDGLPVYGVQLNSGLAIDFKPNRSQETK